MREPPAPNAAQIASIGARRMRTGESLDRPDLPAEKLVEPGRFPDRIPAMHRPDRNRTRRFLSLLACTILAPQLAVAHGSVSAEEDLCAIKIGYFKAHFKIYVPQETGRDDYCEDIPAVGDSVFVMEYLHSGLGEIPIDFRIIRDVTGMGTFARWEDIEQIDDLESATVFYQPASIVPDVFTVKYDFDEPGDYIGIVTAVPSNQGKAYTAVFPFEVGFTGFGYWPLIVLLVAGLQINYWFMSGRFSRNRARKTGRLSVVDGP